MSFLMENVGGVVGASYEPAPRATSEQDRLRNVAAFVTTFCRRSQDYTISSRRRMPALYDLYRNVSRNSDHPFRNNVATNALFAAVEADCARKARALLDGKNIAFQGTSIPGGASFARKQEALYYQQLREDGGLLKKYLAMKASALYGVAVMQKGWRYETRDAAKFEIVQSPVDGKRYRVGRPVRDVVFDGPSAVNIDVLDFFLEAGRNNIKEARRAAKRWFEELDAVEARFAVGEFTQTSELARLKQTGAVGTQMYNDLKQLRGLDAIQGDPKQYNPYSRPVQLVDFFGYVPKELTPDGITFRRIVVANNAFVMLDEPFPYAHGRLDFVFMSYSPFYDPHYFFAPGKVEVGIALQRAQNKFLNQGLDVFDLAIAPPTFIDKAMMVDPRSMQMKAGRIMETQGDPHAGIYQYQFPLNGVEAGFNAVEMLGTMIQRGTGIVDDVGQGLPSNPRETARGVLARSEAQGSRLDTELWLWEEMIDVPDAEGSMELNRQFLTDSREAELIGDLAEMDPVTGGTNQFPSGSLVTVKPEDVAYRLRARATGTATRTSRSMGQQNFTIMMQAAFQAAAAGGPAMIAQMNLLGWIRQMAEKYDVGPEVNELVLKDPSAYGAQLALMMMANQKGAEQLLGPGAPPALGGMNGPSFGGQQAGVTPAGGGLGQMVGNISGGLTVPNQ